MFRGLLFVFLVVIVQVSFVAGRVYHEIGTKPFPLVGKHDESRSAYLSTLAEPERLKTEPLMDKFKEVDITASDGITLKAIVFDPNPAANAQNNPVVIFCSSWGMNKWEYVVPASKLADAGYTVVSYTARGFWGSGGQINLAGSKDMSDVSSVIDWTLANTRADLNRIGMSGISYGGGMSILATAHDTRVRTATSMSCWIDLAESMLGNGETIRKEAVRFLQVLALLTGEVSDELSTLFSDYFSNEDLPYMYAMTANSSAITYIDSINANKPNIFIANAFGDSLFTPNQFPTKFFDVLTGNKHLEFAPGDHAGPELTGLLGIPDATWTRAYQWMDYYVRDAHSDVFADMPAVQLQRIDSGKGTSAEEFDSWAQVTSTYQVYSLSRNEKLSSVSTLNNKKNDVNVAKEVSLTLQRGGEEVSSLTTGDNANIRGGIAFITSTIRAYIDQPLHFLMPLISRKYGAVFQTSRLSYSMHLRGNALIHLDFIPKSSSVGTFIVFLLDVDPLTNVGRLITFSPWTFKNATPGKQTSVDIEMTTTSYDIAEKRQLAVVIATKDLLYLDQSPSDVEISFLSSSTVAMPLHY